MLRASKTWRACRVRGRLSRVLEGMAAEREGEEMEGQGLHLSTLRAYKPLFVVRNKVQTRLCN